MAVSFGSAYRGGVCAHARMHARTHARTLSLCLCDVSTPMLAVTYDVLLRSASAGGIVRYSGPAGASKHGALFAVGTDSTTLRVSPLGMHDVGLK